MMKDEQLMAAIRQWLIPTAVLLIATVIMFINFFVQSNQQAEENVEKDIAALSEKYAAQLHNDIIRMAAAGKCVIGTLSGGSAGRREAVVAAQSLTDSAGAYLAVWSDGSGNGITHKNEIVALMEMEYYLQASREQDTYHYVEDDGITGKSAILACLPAADKGMLLLYFDADGFCTQAQEERQGNNPFYVLMDGKGNILSKEGAESSFLLDDNLWSRVRPSEALNKAKIRLQNQYSGAAMLSAEGERRCIAFAPVGAANLYFILGVEEHYVAYLQGREWKNIKDMIFRLLLLISVFLAAVVVINVVGRIRANENHKNLEYKADSDQLTELNNKAATERKIKEYIRKNPRGQGVMFVLDIDNFKKINDTMGHAFGDEVLRTLGRQIQAEFRVTDIIGRTGGDEFIIFLKDLKDENLIKREAARVAHFFKNFQAGEYVKYSATASIGAAVYPADAADFENLYKAADQALYLAKKRGKNQLAFYRDVKQQADANT